ncbi:MAG: M67 family peptidase [Oscillatoriales cyanobacterium]|nr:MAG: M67 family peptidase [Oscillatoriales cyanobacterium]
MIEHAEHSHPEECCGLLVGQIQGDRIAAIEVYPMANQWNLETGPEFEAAISAPKPATLPSRERRYTIDPRAMLEVQKLARDRGLTIVGVYHSHPEHPAIPSEYDRELAWADYVYPIVSVRRGYPSAVRVWQLDDDQQFVELELCEDLP